MTETMPTAAHVIYIPGMLLLGVVIGYMLGTRAARDAMLADKARQEARAARRAARQAAAESEAPAEKEPPSADAPSAE